MSVGRCSEKFNIVSNDHGRTRKCDFCVPPVLQIITHLIQYTVLETRFWPVKYTTATVQYTEISSTFIPFRQHQVMQAIAMIRLYGNKPLQNAFKRI